MIDEGVEGFVDMAWPMLLGLPVRGVWATRRRPKIEVRKARSDYESGRCSHGTKFRPARITLWARETPSNKSIMHELLHARGYTHPSKIIGKRFRHVLPNDEASDYMLLRLKQMTENGASEEYREEER